MQSVNDPGPVNSQSESYGPFFARYLSSKLWEGQTFVMQVDSHSHFKKGWDDILVAMLRRAPSYPHALVSNYPVQFFFEHTVTKTQNTKC